MLDAIIDLRTPRFLMTIRNAFGGAYASYNNYPTGADFVCALPTTRAAVMGPAGVEYVFKEEVRAIGGSIKQRIAVAMSEKVAEGLSEADAKAQAENEVADWQKSEEAVLAKKYEEQLMNPNEALSLGSISQIVMPSDLRKVLSQQMDFHMRHYQPEPLSGVQREFH
jgi:acetyl-CoA carboxylase carboxyltransferase component